MVAMSTGTIETALDNTTVKFHHNGNKSVIIHESIDGDEKGLIVVENTLPDKEILFRYKSNKRNRKSRMTMPRK